VLAHIAFAHRLLLLARSRCFSLHAGIMGFVGCVDTQTTVIDHGVHMSAMCFSFHFRSSVARHAAEVDGHVQAEQIRAHKNLAI